MIVRKQKISLQLNQLIDAVLLGAVFWLCHFLLSSKSVFPDPVLEMPGFTHFLWMLAVIVPFGPFLLELQGFYNYQLEKSLLRSLGEIVQAGFRRMVTLSRARPIRYGHPDENNSRRIGRSTCKIKIFVGTLAPALLVPIPRYPPAEILLVVYSHKHLT